MRTIKSLDDLKRIREESLKKQLKKETSGKIEYGPLIQIERSAGRRLKQAFYVRRIFSK